MEEIIWQFEGLGAAKSPAAALWRMASVGRPATWTSDLVLPMETEVMGVLVEWSRLCAMEWASSGVRGRVSAEESLFLTTGGNAARASESALRHGRYAIVHAAEASIWADLGDGYGVAQRAAHAVWCTQANRNHKFTIAQDITLTLMLCRHLAPLSTDLRERLEQDRDDRYTNSPLRPLRLWQWRHDGLPGLDLIEEG